VKEMMNLSKITKVLSIALAATAFILLSGNSTEGFGQRDPFAKAPHQKPQTPKPAANPAATSSNKSTKSTAPVKKGPFVVDAPPIEARIDYYKRIREEAAMNGQTLPKVTSVLLVNEMSVTGVFKTPRGYAAIVEATPIKLSYTIYPGEKFFDGQLVAVEENRLIFRKVTKWSNNKFISSVENKPLRKYSLQQDIQGTAPRDPYDSAKNESKPQTAQNTSSDSESNEVTPGVIVSPLEEMNNQPAEEDKDSAKEKTNRGKKGKKRASKSKKRS
jgi:hypothetical protein